MSHRKPPRSSGKCEYVSQAYAANKGLVNFLRRNFPMIDSQLTISFVSPSERHHQRVNKEKSKQKRALYQITPTSIRISRVTNDLSEKMTIH